MQLTVSGMLNQFHRILQGVLFPALDEQLGPLSDKHRQRAAVLSMIEIEGLVASWPGGVGRPARHRRAIARAFVAKAVFHLNATRQLLDRLSIDVSLRRMRSLPSSMPQISARPSRNSANWNRCTPRRSRPATRSSPPITSRIRCHRCRRTWPCGTGRLTRIDLLFGMDDLFDASHSVFVKLFPVSGQHQTATNLFKQPDPKRIFDDIELLAHP
jgi:hypothetical protein